MPTPFWEKKLCPFKLAKPGATARPSMVAIDSAPLAKERQIRESCCEGPDCMLFATLNGPDGRAQQAGCAPVVQLALLNNHGALLGAVSQQLSGLEQLFAVSLTDEQRTQLGIERAPKADA